MRPSAIVCPSHISATGVDPETPPGPKQLARFLKKLCNTKPVYGFQIDISMPVNTADGHMYAKTFMEYYQASLFFSFHREFFPFLSNVLSAQTIKEAASR